MEPVVCLRGAVVVIGRFPALSGIDLDVAAGEIVLLRGANGSGKTTLLRTCAGLLSPARGSVQVLGQDLVANPRAVRRRVALSGHNTGLYDELTALENARFWARAAGATTADADRSLRRVGLEPRLDRIAVSRLSAGQRRRVGLATVIARRPELWLLDEPHAGLDQAGRDLLDDLVTEAAGAGATIMLASHDLDRATKLADRVVMLAGGTVGSDDYVGSRRVSDPGATAVARVS